MCALRTILQKSLRAFMVQSTAEDEVLLEALRVTAAIIAVEPIRDDPADPSLLGRGRGWKAVRDCVLKDRLQFSC